MAVWCANSVLYTRTACGKLTVDCVVQVRDFMQKNIGTIPQLFLEIIYGHN